MNNNFKQTLFESITGIICGLTFSAFLIIYQPLPARQIIGYATQIIYPGITHCGRCKMSWSVTKSHDLSFDDLNGRGMFALCERCNSELTPIERLPYYREVVDELWIPQGDTEMVNKWPQIAKSVLEGN